MKTVNLVKGSWLILLLLQLGFAPCAGACSMPACSSRTPVHAAVLGSSAPSCHHSGAGMQQTANPKLLSSGLQLCCRGASELPLAVSPQEVLKPRASQHAYAIQTAAENTGLVCFSRLAGTHSGEPPPAFESRAIYRLICDLRI
jgi:hypothetical protein